MNAKSFTLSWALYVLLPLANGTINPIDGYKAQIKITEKKIMDVKTDKFEEDRYERTMKQNFASSIFNKLRSELIIINDI